MRLVYCFSGWVNTASLVIITVKTAHWQKNVPLSERWREAEEETMGMTWSE